MRPSLLIDARIGDPKSGGIGRYTHELCSRLRLAAPHWSVFVLGSDRAVRPGLTPILGKYHPRTMAGMREIGRVISVRQPHLVHFPHPYIPLPPRRGWPPYLATIHDLIPFHFPTRAASTRNPLSTIIERATRRVQIREISKRAARVITVSRATCRDLLTLGFAPDQVKVIPLANDHLSGACPSAPCEFRSPADSYFLIIGACYPHKNLEILLEIAGLQPRLTLVRCGPDNFFSRRLKGRAQSLGLTLTNRYLDWGEVSDHVLGHLIGGADAILIPSLAEGYSLAVAEACRLQVPAMVSLVGSLPEVGANQVSYVSPFDRHFILEVIEEMIKVKIPPALPSDQRTWDEVARETVSLYDALAVSS